MTKAIPSTICLCISGPSKLDLLLVKYVARVFIICSACCVSEMAEIFTNVGLAATGVDLPADTATVSSVGGAQLRRSRAPLRAREDTPQLMSWREEPNRGAGWRARSAACAYVEDVIGS